MSNDQTAKIGGTFSVALNKTVSENPSNGTANISIKIDRDDAQFDANTMDAIFTNATLNVVIDCGPAGTADIHDQSGDQEVMEGGSTKVEGQAQCAGLRPGEKQYTGSLRFVVDTVKGDTLLAVTSKSGRLTAARLGDGDGDVEDDDGE